MLGSEASETPKPEHQQYNSERRAQKILFVREFCYPHYSIPHFFLPRRWGSAGSKLFSELGD